MLFSCIAVALLAVASAQSHYYESSCPPENSWVVAFRNLTDVREPLHIPHIEKVLKDAGYAKEEFQALIRSVDLPWKVTLEVNGSSLAYPFLERCCPEETWHQCTFRNIVLQYLNFLGGVCWVVWPEPYYVYKRCTCCSCLCGDENDNCPVVGRCVETDYVTVVIIAYCPHIMYSDRWQRIAMTLPTNCRCQAACPTPEPYPEPFNSPAEEKVFQKAFIPNYDDSHVGNLADHYNADLNRK